MWTAFSRAQNRIVAFHIGDRGAESAITLYKAVKQRIPRIGAIFTDANSCYRIAFERLGVSEPHEETKAQTHLIEASNSSIRDNLARFNRRSKRFSKSWAMLEITLNLFCHRHLISQW